MNAGLSRQPPKPGDAGLGPYSGMGDAGRLRDADWAAQHQLRGGGEQPARTQLLHRWNIPAGESAGALLFQPLDGNPRHGVLALYLSGGFELHGAIEILERQGGWLVMPDSVRARMLAASSSAIDRRTIDRRSAVLMPRSRIAGTPDRRFVFFNTLLGGGTVTLVERRQDGGVAVT